MARRRLTVQEAAEVLGASVDAVRSRIRRGSLDSEKGEDGRVYVWLGSDQADDEPQRQVEGGEARELIEVLRAQVEDLRGRLDRETEANRENRRIIAGLIERVPELEAPSQEPRGSNLSAQEERTTSTPGEPQPGPETPAPRPWWRRIFGG